MKPKFMPNASKTMQAAWNLPRLPNSAQGPAHRCQVSSLPWLCQDRCQHGWNFGAPLDLHRQTRSGWIYQSFGTHFVCQDPGTHHGMVTQTPGFKRECEIIIQTLPKSLAAFFPTSCTVTQLVSQSQEGGYLFIPGLSHSE